MQPQVDKGAYAFGHYSHVGRWASYYHQLRCLLACDPESVLEVGVGDGVVGNFLRGNTGVAYRSLDIATDLRPDVVGSVTDIPLPDKSVSVSCAFEVLEHLPFADFERAVGELSRVARTHVLISLPHYGPALRWSLKLPLLPELRFAWKIPVPKKHVFNGQHEWEIGKRGFPARRVRAVLEKFGAIEREFVPWENQYHHFFIVRLRG